MTMKTDEKIALTALIVAQKWNIPAWFEIQWDATQNKYTTHIETDLPDNTIITYELKTLEDAATLWITSEELHHNQTTLSSTHELTEEEKQAHRLNTIDGLINGTLSRLKQENITLPFSLITYNNWTAPTVDLLPQFTEQEEKTGTFALSFIKLFHDTLAWEDGISIKHQTQHFNRKTLTWDPTPNPHFEVYAILEDFFWATCYDTMLLTPENAELFTETAEEVKFRLGTGTEDEEQADNTPTVEVHAAQLFAARAEQYRSIGNSAKRRIPAELQDLYETTYSYQLGDLIGQ